MTLTHDGDNNRRGRRYGLVACLVNLSIMRRYCGAMLVNFAPLQYVVVESCSALASRTMTTSVFTGSPSRKNRRAPVAPAGSGRRDCMKMPVMLISSTSTATRDTRFANFVSLIDVLRERRRSIIGCPQDAQHRQCGTRAAYWLPIAESLIDDRERFRRRRQSRSCYGAFWSGVVDVHRLNPRNASADGEMNSNPIKYVGAAVACRTSWR